MKAYTDNFINFDGLYVDNQISGEWTRSVNKTKQTFYLKEVFRVLLMVG